MKNLRSELIRVIFIIFVFCSYFGQNHAEGLEADTRTLYEEYESCSNESSYEQLDVLRKLAKECSSVAEIGSSSLKSSWGLLQGLSESAFLERSFLKIDGSVPAGDRLEFAKRVAKEHHIHFTFWHVNDSQIEIEPIDMLSIDSLHSYGHLTYQFETFSPKVRKYIAFPNTSESWGERDDFLKRHPEWILFEGDANHHSLTILKREDETQVVKPIYDPAIEHFLKNKMILCTGPSVGRYELLKNTTEADLNLISFKKIFLTTNDPAILNIAFNGVKPAICQLIENQGKQLDCINCIMTTLKNAVNDPEILDDDILIFKHETVFINDLELLKKALGKLINGYNLVIRNTLFGPGTDVFLAKVSTLRELVRDYSIITEMPENAGNAEGFFGVNIVARVTNVYAIPLEHSHWKFTELGFYHIYPNYSPPGPTDHWGLPWWDKKNYHTLY